MSEKQYKETLHANGQSISILSRGKDDDYISLTDIAKYKSSEPRDVIKNWIRTKDTIDFLGIFETINNPEFNQEEFERIRNEAGRNAFTLSPSKWIELTNAKGIISKPGINGGTYAHKDIAFEFASWVSPEFKLYIIKDYQRLKADENSKISLEWNISRTISKLNYKIHTDAIKEFIIPKQLTQQQKNMTYASEADVINVALFGKTARQWREENPDAAGNIRDNAELFELIILSNLETLNAEYISSGLSQYERLQKLNESARRQMNSLCDGKRLQLLNG